MNIIICKDYQEMSEQAARLLAAQVRLYPDSILGLATGSTPIGCYQELIRMHHEEDLDFSEVETINLDEYVGLPANHEQSYRYFMNTHLFNHINIDPEMTHVPDGMAGDLDEEAENYEMLAEQLGGADIQILGLGPNGHIGFNEPGESFVSPCHVVDLAPWTIEANSRFFSSADDVPKQAITMGIRQIMMAQKILLLASGKGKAEPLQRAILGPVRPDMPASILQFHPDVTVIADEAALSWLYD